MSGSESPDAPAEIPARRRVLFGAILIGLASVAGLVVLEAALQVYHVLKQREARESQAERALVPSDDPVLMFEFAPGLVRGEFTVNSRGMPDDEVTREKPKGTFRIAFVGDSISANYGHRPRPEIYLEVLADMLNQRATDGTHFESLNFGVNAYSILQSLRVAQTRALELDPDVIVAQLCLNDPYPSDTEIIRLAPLHPLRTRNMLLRLTRPDRYSGYFFVDRLYDEQGWANVREGLEGFAALARERPLLTVFFPYLYEPGYSQWNYGEIHAGYRREAAAAGVPFVDLLPTFREAGLLRDTWPIDPMHPDAETHALAARVLQRELDSRGWLPDSG